jgi:hypothetical protein
MIGDNMPEDTQGHTINLNTLLSLPPEEVLAVIASEVKRHANSIEGFSIILSKDEFVQEHSYAIQQIERQAKSTKSIIDVVWVYLAQRGYLDADDHAHMML